MFFLVFTRAFFSTFSRKCFFYYTFYNSLKADWYLPFTAFNFLKCSKASSEINDWWTFCMLMTLGMLLNWWRSERLIVSLLWVRLFSISISLKLYRDNLLMALALRFWTVLECKSWVSWVVSLGREVKVVLTVLNLLGSSYSLLENL